MGINEYVNTVLSCSCSQFGTCGWFVSEGKVTPELHPLLEELRLHGEVVGSTDVEIPELLRAGDSAPLHA